MLFYSFLFFGQLLVLAPRGSFLFLLLLLLFFYSDLLFEGLTFFSHFIFLGHAISLLFRSNLSNQLFLLESNSILSLGFFE